MTAKRRLAKPTSHANDRMVNVRRDCHPTVCVFASVESTFRSFVADASFRSTTSILDEEATLWKINQSAVTSCEICFSLSHSTFTVCTWDGSLLFFSLYISACLLSFFHVTNNIGPMVAFLSNLIPTVIHLPTRPPGKREKNFFLRSPCGEDMKDPGNKVVIKLI